MRCGLGGHSAQDDERVFVKEGERCRLVPVSDIYLLESEGYYTRLYFAKSARSSRVLSPRSNNASIQQSSSAPAATSSTSNGSPPSNPTLP
jgi:hypothetical protein